VGSCPSAICSSPRQGQRREGRDWCLHTHPYVSTTACSNGASPAGTRTIVETAQGRRSRTVARKAAGGDGRPTTVSCKSSRSGLPSPSVVGEAAGGGRSTSMLADRAMEGRPGLGRGEGSPWAVGRTGLGLAAACWWPRRQRQMASRANPTAPSALGRPSCPSPSDPPTSLAPFPL
jgi:hypothetical protein